MHCMYVTPSNRLEACIWSRLRSIGQIRTRDSTVIVQITARAEYEYEV